MKALTARSKQNLMTFAYTNGIHPSDALNVVLEALLPSMSSETIQQLIAQSDIGWTRMAVGDVRRVEVGPGEEAAFRARICRFRKNTGRHIVVRKVGPTSFELTRPGTERD